MHGILERRKIRVERALKRMQQRGEWHYDGELEVIPCALLKEYLMGDDLLNADPSGTLLL